MFLLARGIKILIWIAWSTTTMWENGNCFAKLSLSHFLDGYRESSLCFLFFLQICNSNSFLGHLNNFMNDLYCQVHICYSYENLITNAYKISTTLRYFVFSLKDGTSLIIDNFEIPAVFACRLAGKKCGNFKIVDDKAGSIL